MSASGINENGDQYDDVALPGFRFHPTDEELVGFYLRRKVEKRPINIELADLFKYYDHDPWDLQKSTHVKDEKDWYFFCKRGRQYRTSIRPNRVTGSGFWKSTGTEKAVFATTNFPLRRTLIYNPTGQGRCSRDQISSAFDHICIDISKANDDPRQQRIINDHQEHIDQSTFESPSVTIMSRTTSELGGHVVGAVMSNALTSSTNSSSWFVCLMQLATVVGLSFTLAGLYLRERRRVLSFRMTKIGAIATASAIIISMTTHLPPPVAWTVGPVAVFVVAIAVILAT